MTRHVRLIGIFLARTAAFCSAYVYLDNTARRVESLEPSDCWEADTLLGKLENAYNQALAESGLLCGFADRGDTGTFGSLHALTAQTTSFDQGQTRRNGGNGIK